MQELGHMANFNVPNSSQESCGGGLVQKCLDTVAGPSLFALVAIVQIVWLYVLVQAVYIWFEA